MISLSNCTRKTEHAVTNEHEILGDTDLETIINDFACKEMRRYVTFLADFFQNTHWQSDRDQSHFNTFFIKYSSQSNAFAITV